jgi:hypothetical protein
MRSASRVGSGATDALCFFLLLLLLGLSISAVPAAVGLCSGLFGSELLLAIGVAAVSAARPADAVKNVKLLNSIAKNKFIRMNMPSTAIDRK